MAQDKRKTLDDECPDWRIWIEACFGPFEREYLRLHPDKTRIDALATVNAASWVLIGELTQERQATAIRLWQQRLDQRPAA